MEMQSYITFYQYPLDLLICVNSMSVTYNTVTMLSKICLKNFRYFSVMTNEDRMSCLYFNFQLPCSKLRHSLNNRSKKILYFLVFYIR